MPNKDELEREINDRLGLDLEWSKMKKDDLLEIRDGLEDEQFVKRFVAQLANDKAGDKVEDQIMRWEPGMMLNMLGEMQQMGQNPSDLILGSVPDDDDEIW